jgi:hypothetical protein
MRIRHRSYWEKSGMTFLSFFALAAILPILLIGVLNSEGLKTMIRANQPNELRIWFEPAEVITHPKVKFKIKVMAEYDSSDSLVPKVETTLKKNGDFNIDNPKISYETPFSGKVVLGNYEMTTNSTGTFSLEIPSAAVFTQLTDLNISTAKAIIYSKP